MYTYVGTSATITLLPHNRCRPSHLRRRRRRGAPSSVCCPPLSFLSYAHCFITTDTVHCFLQLCTKQAPAKNTVPFYAGCASLLVLHTYISQLLRYIPTTTYIYYDVSSGQGFHTQKKGSFFVHYLMILLTIKLGFFYQYNLKQNSLKKKHET